MGSNPIGALETSNFLVVITFETYSSKLQMLYEWGGGGGGGERREGSSQNSKRGGSTPRSNPLPFCLPF